MKRNGLFQRFVLFATFVGTVLVVTKNLPAGLTTDVTHFKVEIDGVDYGHFDQVLGLESMGTQDHFRKVTLKRDFVTDPSVYQWAKETNQNRTGLKDVHLIMENSRGEELSRYVLGFCQPLSWSVEAANPAMGGFHESVDLAVQTISIY